jgi:hypothetical protein
MPVCRQQERPECPTPVARPNRSWQGMRQREATAAYSRMLTTRSAQCRESHPSNYSHGPCMTAAHPAIQALRGPRMLFTIIFASSVPAVASPRSARLTDCSIISRRECAGPSCAQQRHGPLRHALLLSIRPHGQRVLPV